MKKVFLKSKVEDFVGLINKIGLSATYSNVLKNKLDFKAFDKSENIYHLFAFFKDSDLGKKMYSSFFPNKYEEVKNNFTTKNFYYNIIDKKVYWVVSHEDRERVFKLKTDNILNRTVEQRETLKKILKEKYDKMFGYWYEELNDTDWYITDKNLLSTGEYRKVAYNINSVFYSNPKLNLETKSDLIFL